MTGSLNANQIRAYLSIVKFLESPNISKVPKKVIDDKIRKLEEYKSNPTIEFINSDWFFWMAQWTREKKWVLEMREEYTTEWFDHVYNINMSDEEIINECKLIFEN